MFVGAGLLLAAYTMLIRRWRLVAAPATAAVSVLALAAFVPVYFVWLGVDHIAELPPRAGAANAWPKGTGGWY
jgi:hypothetical protein